MNSVVGVEAKESMKAIIIAGETYKLSCLDLNRGPRTYPTVLVGEKQRPVISVEHFNGRPTEHDVLRAELAINSYNNSGQMYNAIPNGELFKGDMVLNVLQAIDDVSSGLSECQLWGLSDDCHIHIYRKEYDEQFYSFNVWDKSLCAQLLLAKPNKCEIEESAIIRFLA